MGSKTDRIKGYANEAGGKIKQGVGKAIGNDRRSASIVGATGANGIPHHDGTHRRWHRMTTAK